MFVTDSPAAKVQDLLDPLSVSVDPLVKLLPHVLFHIDLDVLGDGSKRKVSVRVCLGVDLGNVHMQALSILILNEPFKVLNTSTLGRGLASLTVSVPQLDTHPLVFS